MTASLLRIRVAGAATAALVAWASTGATAQTPTAADLYTRATAKEAAVRDGAFDARAARSAMVSYELIVRRFPRSGYCDNALWQAAGLAVLAFEHTGSRADRTAGEKYLKWLGDSYPHSQLVKQIDTRRAEFSTPAPAASQPPPSASPAIAAAVPASATLKGITREPLPNGDRIVLLIDREVIYSTDRIASPDRVFVDLAGTSASDDVQAAAAGLKGRMVSSVRLGHPTADTTRIAIDLSGAPKHSVYPLYGPYRLVIDAENSHGAGAANRNRPLPPVPATAAEVPASRIVESRPSPNMGGPRPADTPAPASPALSTPPAETAGPMPDLAPKLPALAAASKVADVVIPLPPSSTKDGDFSLARQLGLGVQRIVIDAGHGGHDPGARGNGLVEKDLVLDVALRLKKLLQDRPGTEVVLTRDTDDFIPLVERTAIANRASADLFLSIHANASRRKEARGLETYFLNFASNPEAEEVAARENATSGDGMGHLPEIVKAITLNNKLAESRELAGMVQTSMVRRLKPQNTSVRDLGVKQAPFVVLIGAQMPSVLAEISFVTNKSDASLLKQNAYKQRIAQALFDAIVKYQTSLKKVTTVSAKGR